MMLIIKFRHNLTQKTKSYRNDQKNAFYRAVVEYICKRFNARTPSLARNITEGWEDGDGEHYGEYMELKWFVNDAKEIKQEKIIWLNFVVDVGQLKRNYRKRKYLSKNTGGKNAIQKT